MRNMFIHENLSRIISELHFQKKHHDFFYISQMSKILSNIFRLPTTSFAWFRPLGYLIWLLISDNNVVQTRPILERDVKEIISYPIYVSGSPSGIMERIQRLHIMLYSAWVGVNVIQFPGKWIRLYNNRAVGENTEYIMTGYYGMNMRLESALFMLRVNAIGS